MDGETFRVGDCVYVIADNFDPAWLEDEEDEPCEVGGRLGVLLLGGRCWGAAAGPPLAWALP